MIFGGRDRVVGGVVDGVRRARQERAAELRWRVGFDFVDWAVYC